MTFGGVKTGVRAGGTGTAGVPPAPDPPSDPEPAPDELGAAADAEPTVPKPPVLGPLPAAASPPVVLCPGPAAGPA